ncbi:endolytic transglycosylase MltG [Cohnella rhizosphaerae]|uniref:endolytic transglycosylase MltG n=1 Tax=Cohnella rhizosphaerae TaxID=1457232 RepID=UPI0030B8DFAF
MTNDDLKVDSPYNTYQNKGLPPGPISSTSLKSIEAVLYPADTDYLYYVTKKGRLQYASVRGDVQAASKEHSRKRKEREVKRRFRETATDITARRRQSRGAHSLADASRRRQAPGLTFG